MDRRGFLKNTGLALAGLLAAGLVLPAVVKAAEPVVETPRQPPHYPFPYGRVRDINWELYQNDHKWHATVHGYDRSTYELKFCPLTIPEAEMDYYRSDPEAFETLKYELAARGAQILEDDNCIVLTKI